MYPLMERVRVKDPLVRVLGSGFWDLILLDVWPGGIPK